MCARIAPVEVSCERGDADDTCYSCIASLNRYYSHLSASQERLINYLTMPQRKSMLLCYSCNKLKM